MRRLIILARIVTKIPLWFIFSNSLLQIRMGHVIKDNKKRLFDFENVHRPDG
jgi:hypothetical protein